MMTFSSVFPLLIMVVDIIIMTMCLKRISTQSDFNYFNSYAWMFIVAFGSFLGQLMYVWLENNDNH